MANELKDEELLKLIREWVETEGYTPRRKHMRFLLSRLDELEKENERLKKYTSKLLDSEISYFNERNAAQKENAALKAENNDLKYQLIGRVEVEIRKT